MIDRLFESLSSISPTPILILGGLLAFISYVMRGYATKLGEFLAHRTPVIRSVNKEGNEEVINRIEETDKLAREEIQKKEEKIRQYESEVSAYERIVDSIQDENISRNNLIENYREPLNALIACFTKVETEEKENFILEELRKNGKVKQITGSTYIVPPKDVPEHIKETHGCREEIKEWIEDDIYSDYPDGTAHIGLFGVIDLRNVYSSSDYTDDELSHFFSTIDDEFDLEDIFSAEDFSRILAEENVSLIELIEKGELTFFLSDIVSDKEFEAVQRNHDKIRESLGNPELKELKRLSEEKLSSHLSQYVSDPDKVAEGIKNEVDIWYKELYG